MSSPPPQSFDAAELRSESFKFTQQRGELLQHDEVAANLVGHLALEIRLQVKTNLLFAAAPDQKVRGAGLGPVLLQACKVEHRRLEVVPDRQFRHLGVDAAGPFGKRRQRSDALRGVRAEQQYAIGRILIQHQCDELDELGQ